ncbi:MAG: hypothetical protein K0U45_08205 [Alphaproteobacteria bacterium]|nr:hypothetical protein [Alphaproteobacteria bacterium]
MFCFPHKKLSLLSPLPMVTKRFCVVLFLWFGLAFTSSAQIDDDGMLSHSDVLAAGVKIHYESYLQQVAQQFEGKDRSPQQFSRWPDFLAQANDEAAKQAINFAQEYDVRVAETWEFLDYQLAYAHIRGTSDEDVKQKLLETLTLARMIDQSLDIYWNGIIAARYGEQIRIQQARINKLLRDSRLSNVVNSLLPEEEKQLLRISNDIITILRYFQASRTRLNQLIAQRQNYKLKATKIGIPVNFYDGIQLDQSIFRTFTPFENVSEDAIEFISEQRAYGEITRLFPSVQFALFGSQFSRRNIVRWHNYSSQLGWNLSNVFYAYPLLRTGLTREHARASAMVLVSRNRVAMIEYQQNLANFEAALVQYNNALWSQSNIGIYDVGSIETIAAEVKKILAAVDSSNAFARLQQSYYRLLLGGGYIQLNNINPRNDERSLANLFEIGIQRSLNADAVELDNQLERGLFAEYSDNPSLLRIFQAWQQSLALLFSTNNGTKRVAAENTLPYLQNDTRLSNQDATVNDLLGVADDLPEYRSSFTDEEIAQIRGTDALTQASSTNKETLAVIEKIAESVNKTSETVEQTAQTTVIIQQRLDDIDAKVDDIDAKVEAVEQKSNEIEKRSSEIEKKSSSIEQLIEEAPYKIKGVTEEPVLLVPANPDANKSEESYDFGDFGNFKNE